MRGERRILPQVCAAPIDTLEGSQVCYLAPNERYDSGTLPEVPVSKPVKQTVRKRFTGQAFTKEVK